ncbi:ribonuclease H [Mesorhizobium sp. B2-3-10]|uniref:ribonuclease H family protein n=1 Tax=Mesorhizobium sp. B2-3-10 TaxID=2589954 RepID=UPI00112D8B32|nr:ribonuclease H [Mesorhizobium sp. B2-3-10]TPL97437.1 ribonuclease HI [Mesorhizobium sp. B2-3-10]
MNAFTDAPSGRRLVVHCDGACVPNPGPGGWAATIKLMDGDQEISRTEVVGSEPAKTTNVRMEMSGAIGALRALPEDDGTPVAVFCDNQMVSRGMNEWLSGWIARGWRTAANKPVANPDLWQELAVLTTGRAVTWHWVKGHAGDPHNEEVDALANAAAAKAMRQAQAG